MKQLVLLFLPLVGLALLYAYESNPQHGYDPVEGDVVFQSSHHRKLTDLIESCTHSTISHCGVVVNEGGNWMVIEAIGPVKETPLSEWIARGRNGAFLAERMPLSDQQKENLKRALFAYLGKPYDFKFEMSDDAIYCSELVYKGYLNGVHETLGRLQPLSELDWRGHEDFIKQLSGHNDVPLDRKMITPVELSHASQLHPVYQYNWPVK